jgi:hypothetical protein
MCACNHNPTEQQVTVDVTDTAIVTERADPTDTLFNNPYRDINSFDAPTGFAPADSLHRVLAAVTDIDTTYKLETCYGDCCISYKLLIDSTNRVGLYLFKTDCYEYGFNNHQFLEVEGKLIFVRTFEVGIEQWPTDTTATTWSIKETIWHFAGDTATEQTRTTLTTDYTTTPQLFLAGKPFTVEVLSGKQLRLQKEGELTDLLNIEATE